MNQLKCYIIIGNAHFKANFRREYNWSITTSKSAGITLQRINWLNEKCYKQATELVQLANAINITPVVVIDEDNLSDIFNINGDYQLLNSSFDGLKLNINLKYPKDILDSYFAIFDKRFAAINWHLYRSNECSKLVEFSKNFITEKLASVSASDRDYIAKLNRQLQAETLLQENITFYHQAVPFFKIQPSSDLCELPLFGDEFKAKLLGELKQKLSPTVVSQHVERISVLDGLAELARQGSAIVTTWVKDASLILVRQQLIGMRVAHANAGDQADDLLVSGVFPIQAIFAEDQRILILTLMQHNLENSDLSELSVSAYWDEQPLKCRRLDMGNNTSTIRVEVEMPEHVSSNAFNYFCTFNATEASLRINIDQDV